MGDNMKYVHPNHDHVYYVHEDMWGGYARQGAGGKLEMTRDQLANFKQKLIEGGWNEQSTQR